jgi:hypothetical protein
MDMMLNMFKGHCLHYAAGHHMAVEKWVCWHKEEFSLRMEHTLVSPRVEDVMEIYPRGTYQCSCCKSNQTMDEEFFAYLSEDLRIMCLQCRHTTFHRLRNIRPMIVRMPGVSMAMPPWEHLIYIDRRPKTAEERQEKDAYYAEVCTKVAEVHDMTYLGGKAIGDIRTELLAKRCVTRWRKFMQRRNAARVFQVLYRCCDLGLDASIVLSRHAVMLA